LQRASHSDRDNTLIDRLVWALISLYILFFGCITSLKFQLFEYRDFDLAVHAQIIWNILHGSVYNSILGIGFIGNHTHLISFLVAPIYFIFRHPTILLLLQTFSLGIAAYPIYLIAKDELGKKIGLAIVFIYLSYPALWYSNLFEFHPTTFATAFLAFMFYYFKKQNFKKFVIFMTLALLCQENISLIIVPVGIYAVFLKRNLKWILTPLLLGISWFLISVGILIPCFNKDTVQFIKIYQHLGSSMSEVITSIVVHPIKMSRIIFMPQKILFMKQLLMPLLFFSLFDSSILIVALVFSQHLFSLRASEHAIYYHYIAEMIPFIFISAIYGIKRFLGIPYIRTNLSKRTFISIIIIFAISSNFLLGSYSELTSSIGNLKKDIWDYQKERFLNRIPSRASIVSTFEFLPRLSQRKNLYSFHHVLMGFYTLSDKAYILPEQVEYALLDFNDSLSFGSFYIPSHSEANLMNFILKNNWGIVDMLGNLVLLKKGYISDYRFYEALKKVPKISNSRRAIANNELEFLGYDIKYEKKILKGQQIGLVLYWKALKRIKGNYGNFIDIVDRYGNIRHRFIKPICYRIFPTYMWQDGDTVKEEYSLFIPEDIEKDTFSVKMGVFDYTTGKTYFMFSSLANSVDSRGRVNLESMRIIKRQDKCSKK